LNSSITTVPIEEFHSEDNAEGDMIRDIVRSIRKVHEFSFLGLAFSNASGRTGLLQHLLPDLSNRSGPSGRMDARCAIQFSL
jgi:hypothetical protein